MKKEYEDNDCNEAAVKSSKTTKNSEKIQTDYSIPSKEMRGKQKK